MGGQNHWVDRDVSKYEICLTANLQLSSLNTTPKVTKTVVPNFIPRETLQLQPQWLLDNPLGDKPRTWQV